MVSRATVCINSLDILGSVVQKHVIISTEKECGTYNLSQSLGMIRNYSASHYCVFSYVH